MRDSHQRMLMQEMTRKQFLQLLAGGLVAIFGFGNIISLLTHSSQRRTQAVSDGRHGFGSRKFGA